VSNNGQFYDGKNAGLIAFYQIDDSTIPAQTDDVLKDIPMVVVNNTG